LGRSSFAARHFSSLTRQIYKTSEL